MHQQRASAVRSSRVDDTQTPSLQHHLHNTQLNLSRPQNRKRQTQELPTTSMETVPLIQCIGCHCDVCTGTCLATHRARYCCHNPRCIFHAPCPAPAEPAAIQPAGTSSTTERALVQVSTPSAGDAAEAEGAPAVTSDDPNVIFRETIIREWRLVETAGGPVTGQAVALGPTTPPAADAPSSAHEGPSSISPARFTIEEYEAQARLLAQFQQPQGQQPQGQQPQQGQRSASTGRNGRGQGARTRPTVRIQFN